MKALLPELWQAFFAELAERVQRAQRTLDAADDDTFDRLHQEFDTLYGAARAVDCVCLEQCNRRLAEYVRLLKRRDTPLAEGRTLLANGIGLEQQCVAHGRCRSDCPSRAEMTQLLAVLDKATGGKE